MLTNSARFQMCSTERKQAQKRAVSLASDPLTRNAARGRPTQLRFAPAWILTKLTSNRFDWVRKINLSTRQKCPEWSRRYRLTTTANLNITLSLPRLTLECSAGVSLPIAPKIPTFASFFRKLPARFFLAQRIPHHRSTLKAFDFPPKCFHRGFPSSGRPSLRGPKKLAGQPSPVEQEWRKITPDAIRPAAGRLNLAAFYSPMINANLQGSDWIRQFVFGFPLVGGLIRRLTYPLGIKVETYSTLHPGELFASSRARFDERAQKDGGGNAHSIFGEDSDHQSNGWITQPFPLRPPSSSSCVVADGNRNIAFRFGAHQGEKVRVATTSNTRSPT